MKSLEQQELERARNRVIIEISKIDKRKLKVESVPNIRNIRRPRLERDRGRGGMLRRQQQRSLLDTQRINLLERKRLLDKQLKEQNDKKGIFQSKQENSE